MKILKTLSEDIAFDVKMGETAFGGYAPTAPVLATRAFNRIETEVRALLVQVSPLYWMERASECGGRTYHIGHSRLVGDAYRAEMGKIAAVLKANGYRVRVSGKGSSEALYLTLDPKVGEEATAAHVEYLRLLAANGAYLPLWAKEMAL